MQLRRSVKAPGIFLSAALLASALVAAGGIGHAAAGCSPLFTDAREDAANNAPGALGQNEPNLDILSGGIVKETPASGDAPATFTTELTIANLTRDFPDNATANMTWYFQWTYNEVDYYAAASIPRLTPDTVLYSFGTFSPPRFVKAGDTTGSFNEGENGTIRVDVPVEAVGAPPAGAQLTNTYANSRVGVGVPTGSPSLVSQVDRAPDGTEFGAAAKLGTCSGTKLKSPGVKLSFSDTTPKRGSTVKAKTGLKTCVKALKGTKIRLQKKKAGTFKTVAAKTLSSNCKATFGVKAKFKKAVFRSFWPKQAKAFKAGASKGVTVTTHR